MFQSISQANGNIQTNPHEGTCVAVLTNIYFYPFLDFVMRYYIKYKFIDGIY